MRLFVVVQGDEIVVTSETGFRAAYCKRPNFPQLKVRRRTDTDDHELLAQAWQAANAKARELGVDNIRGALPIQRQERPTLSWLHSPEPRFRGRIAHGYSSGADERSEDRVQCDDHGRARPCDNRHWNDANLPSGLR